MKIFVVNHTKFEQTYKDQYYPLLVGAFMKGEEVKESVFCDDTGENISLLNRSYCELTGLYWIWKNVEDPIVGLAHYRRFFLTARKYFSFRDYLYLLHPEKTEDCHIMTGDEAEKILTSYDLIIKKSRRYHFTIKEKLLRDVPGECLANLLEVLYEINPEDYTKFKEYLNEQSHILYNIFIGKKEIIDRYCEWLFPILMSVDRKHMSKYGMRYCRREIGYLGEILFSYWIISNNINYYNAEVIAPRHSSIHEVDGIIFPDGTNLFPVKEFIPHVLSKVSRWKKR